MPAAEFGWAHAVIGTDVVDALAVVDARTGQALVQIQLAVLALEADRAVAHVRAVVVVAHAVVQTRIRQALVDIYLAIGAFVAGRQKEKRKLAFKFV